MRRTVLHSGVYTITNTVNGRVYVGSAAKSFKSRWQKHLSDLKHNKHRNSMLQRAFNKYGKESFRFEIVAVCPAEYVLKLEQFFIESINPYYNICKVAGSSLGVKRTAEYKKKLSDASKGRKRSDAFKEACRLRMMGNSITKGMKQRPEVIAKQSERQKGTKHSEYTKNKMSLKGKGRITSDEAKKKLSEARLRNLYIKKHGAEINTSVEATDKTLTA